MKEKGMSKGEFNAVASVNGGMENMINPDFKDKDLSGSRLELNAEVLREQTIDSQETDTGYGCRFIGVSHSQEETISRYIYKLQFEMLQKEREKRDMF